MHKIVLETFTWVIHARASEASERSEPCIFVSREQIIHINLGVILISLASTFCAKLLLFWPLSNHGPILSKELFGHKFTLFLRS